MFTFYWRFLIRKLYFFYQDYLCIYSYGLRLSLVVAFQVNDSKYNKKLFHKYIDLLLREDQGQLKMSTLLQLPGYD